MYQSWTSGPKEPLSWWCSGWGLAPTKRPNRPMLEQVKMRAFSFAESPVFETQAPPGRLSLARWEQPEISYFDVTSAEGVARTVAGLRSSIFGRYEARLAIDDTVQHREKLREGYCDRVLTM